jgi:uncharacterized iron-regulated membrane protein
MAWIHGWMGLLAGWILFAMFLTGTASYFRPEITRWMQPELRAQPVAPEDAAAAAVRYLQRTAPGAEQWYIYMPDARTTSTRVFVRDKPTTPPAPRRPEIRLDPATGEPLHARETRGGEHFYRFHFQLQLPHPWGRWLAGLCAMLMLAAIISGVITHKRIFADFFMLRWGRGQRSWLDAHNASAVLALPYHAMITYTGLITLALMYMPWPIAANYAKPAAFAAEAYGTEPDTPALGRPAPLVPVAPLVRSAIQEWQSEPPGRIVIRNPNDAGARITMLREGTASLSARQGAITWSGSDGRRLSVSPESGPAVRTAAVMLGLHLGWFADTGLRWVLFALGLTGTAMVGTGLVLWTEKRLRKTASPIGHAVVQRLNIGTIACLPAGMAAFFLANRLLPAAMPDRAAFEVSAMFYTWFGLAAFTCLRPIRRAWPEALGIAAAAFLAVPLVNMATTDRGLPQSIAQGDGLFVAFDLVMLGSAVLLGFAAWQANRIARRVSRREPASVELDQERLAHAA